MTFGEVSGIISLVWLIFEKGLKSIRAISAEWIRHGKQTDEWRTCACGYGTSGGAQLLKCPICGVSGRVYPGFWWRLRKTLKSLLIAT